MKLYATITSERGKTLGKGANDYLDIELKAFDRENPIGYIILITHPDNPETWEVRWQRHKDDEWEIIAQGQKK